MINIAIAVRNADIGILFNFYLPFSFIIKLHLSLLTILSKSLLFHRRNVALHRAKSVRDHFQYRILSDKKKNHDYVATLIHV